MSLEVPFAAYLQAQIEKNRNQQNTWQNIAGIGQGIGSMGDSVHAVQQQMEQEKAKQQLLALLKQPQNLTVQGPQNAPPQGPSMTGAPMQAPIGGMQPGQQVPNPALDFSSVAGPMSKLYPDKFASLLQDKFDPLKQAQANRWNALAAGGGKSTKPVQSVWRNAETNEVRDTPPEDPLGWTEYKVSPGQALATAVNTPFAKEKADAQRDRTAMWGRSIDAGLAKDLVKRTGLTTKQLSSLQTNNLRADRAIDILSKPNITWNELALGEIDLAGLMQGGAPHVDEFKAVHFPGWQENWSKWKTYATGHPNENVPPDIQNKVLNLVQGVKKIDNKFIDANAEFSKNTLEPMISGGGKAGRIKAIDTMTSTMTGGGLTPQEQEEFKKLDAKFGKKK